MSRTFRTDAQLALDVAAHTARQNADRGAWSDPRADAHMPDPAFPDPDNPVLDYLVRTAEASLRRGENIQLTLVHLAVHAWFEGGVAGYDRGRGDTAHDPDSA
ncbi:hypothetical protein [Aeromicrobium sp. Leaf291]|uniref:hypothetical protein n=1 Tax=Aeromicrobium sp. Leaf291 TaxID=1736325 RepID=UPI000A763AC7|nr:hypothetical protein [Aeromicrobium sp. Leaf291]